MSITWRLYPLSIVWPPFGPWSKYGLNTPAWSKYPSPWSKYGLRCAYISAINLVLVTITFYAGIAQMLRCAGYRHSSRRNVMPAKSSGTPTHIDAQTHACMAQICARTHARTRTSACTHGRAHAHMSADTHARTLARQACYSGREWHSRAHLNLPAKSHTLHQAILRRTHSLERASFRIADCPVHSPSAVADRQSVIANRQSTIADGQSDIVDQMSVIVDRQSATTDQQSVIVDRQSAITERQSAVDNKQSAITERRCTFADRQSVITDRRSAFSDRKSVITDRRSAFADRQSAVAHRQLAIADGSGLAVTTDTASARWLAAVAENRPAEQADVIEEPAVSPVTAACIMDVKLDCRHNDTRVRSSSSDAAEVARCLSYHHATISLFPYAAIPP